MSKSTETPIEKIYAAIGTTEDGREGIASVTAENGSTMPLVGPPSSLPQLREFIKAVAESTKTPLVLTEWSGRQDIEVIGPGEGGS